MLYPFCQLARHCNSLTRSVCIPYVAQRAHAVSPVAPRTCRANQTEHCFDTPRSLPVHGSEQRALPQNADHLEPYTNITDRATLLSDFHAVAPLQGFAHFCVLTHRDAWVVDDTFQPLQQIMVCASSTDILQASPRQNVTYATMPGTLCFEVVVTKRSLDLADELTGDSVFEPVLNIFNAQGTHHLIEIVDIKKKTRSGSTCKERLVGNMFSAR